jgi:PEP-CTERM motif
MNKAILLSAILLLALTSFADTSINNFNGYNDYWYPFGDPVTSIQTFGEIFTAPDGINNLSSFSFYMGNPLESGDIITGAYIATWTGTHAGTLLYDSGQYTYDNAGNEELTFNTGGLFVTPGQQYVMFLSTSNFHGQSQGEAYVPAGNTNPYLDGFAYFNNGNEFGVLFSLPWDGYGLQPDWAVDLEFNNVPEPGTLMLLGTGVLGAIAVLRRKLAAQL